ncbi:MAG: hypothetical protein LAN84_15110 [Acidobacteriia bacterium]|nr:hypothetical protein [Terriglobia bacterium]
MYRTKYRTLVRWALAAVLALTLASAASPAQGQQAGGNHCDESPGQARKHGCYGGAGSGHSHAHRSRHNSSNRAGAAADVRPAERRERAPRRR